MSDAIRNAPLVTAGRHAPRRSRAPTRHANQGGDPVESARLRPLFLVWVGKRSNAAALKAAGIPYGHGANWLNDRSVLGEEHQKNVRRLLDEAGVVGCEPENGENNA